MSFWISRAVNPLPNAPGAAWGWPLALVPCAATLRMVHSHLAVLPWSYLPTDMSNKLQCDVGRRRVKLGWTSGREHGRRPANRATWKGRGRCQKVWRYKVWVQQRGFQRTWSTVGSKKNPKEYGRCKQWKEMGEAEQFSFTNFRTNTHTSQGFGVLCFRSPACRMCSLHIRPLHLSKCIQWLQATAQSFPSSSLELHAGTCKHRSIKREVVCKTVDQIQCGDLGSRYGKGYVFLGVCTFVWTEEDLVQFGIPKVCLEGIKFPSFLLRK